MREKLNLLLVKHCASIKNTVGLLGQHLREIGQGDVRSAQGLEDAVALAHQLKGSSGTAGFQDICTAATVLYNHLKAGNGRLPEMQQTMALYERLDAATGAADPTTSSLYLVAAQKAER
jgi:HPt (histidine-containing phosphotransfer) domain-containing protein